MDVARRLLTCRLTFPGSAAPADLPPDLSGFRSTCGSALHREVDGLRGWLAAATGGGGGRRRPGGGGDGECDTSG
eukprot:365738-Chlamydomonas_euryale.AAC.20